MLKKDLDSIRKWLKGYRLLTKELQARTEHINWLRDEVFTPLSVSGRGSDRHAAEKVRRITTDILHDAQFHLDQLRRKLELIEEEIRRLDDYERCVVYNRYILGISWLDMPERVGYEVAQCQRIERKALAHLAQSRRVQNILNQDAPTPVCQPINNLALSECAPVL